jgi:hypothetical protein
MKALYVLRTSALCFAVVALSTRAGNAQTPDLPEVPEGLSAEPKEKLEAERKRLVDEEASVRAGWAQHEKKCRGVVAGSPEHTKCLQLRDALVARARKIPEQKKAYVTTYHSAINAELQRLTEQENALTQTIVSGMQTLQTMVTDTSLTSGDLLKSLNDELKKHVDRLMYYRKVRRTLAILAVRG